MPLTSLQNMDNKIQNLEYEIILILQETSLVQTMYSSTY